MAITTRARQNNTESGVTLVELMITMVISSVVIFFLFSVQTRMSRAYQGQSTLPEINQNLQAARQMFLSDLRMAGYGFPTKTPAPAPAITQLGKAGVASAISLSGLVSALTITNNAYPAGAGGEQADSIRILYGDASTELLVDISPPSTNLTNDKLKIVAATPIPAGYFDTAATTPTPLLIASAEHACVVGITSVTANEIFFANAGLGLPFNTAGSAFCADVNTDLGGVSPMPVRVMKLVTHSYRIDPDRAESGFLQMSPSGEAVASDWIDMGVGFTNLQFATRYFDSLSTALDVDGDGDNQRNWFSSANQNNPSGTVSPIQVTVSIEARSPYGTRGSAESSATPAFMEGTLVTHNSIGDWGKACPSSTTTNPCGVDLVHDGTRPPRYVGPFVYRSVTTTIDLRNMGIGE